MIPFMKNTLLFALPALLLLSCKKSDPTDTEAFRLVQTKTGTLNGDVYYVTLDYDGQGRITRISQSTNNNTAVVSANISYSGNEVLIVEPAVNNAAQVFTREIKYVIDGSNRPLSRIEQRTEEYKAPAAIPQRTFYSDTAAYTYDANGLLLRKTGSTRDSTWFNPGQVQTMVGTEAYTATYTNTNGNLSEMVKTTIEKYRTVSGFATYSDQSSEEEKIAFEYTKSYANKTDFKNAFLLEEFEVLLYRYPLNKIYRNLPDRFTQTIVTRDAMGAVTGSESSSGTIALTYNKYGFVELIGDNPVRTQNKELIYTQ